MKRVAITPPPRQKRGVKPKRRPRLRAVLTPEQAHERDLHRAWAWGERYRRNGWHRLPPPRFRSKGPHDDNGVATTAAFLRGYDMQTRRVNRLRTAGQMSTTARQQERATMQEETAD